MKKVYIPFRKCRGKNVKRQGPTPRGTIKKDKAELKDL